eukprot:scaffold32972_cov28-Tisochrysis_lutea.AAC.13
MRSSRQARQVIAKAGVKVGTKQSSCAGTPARLLGTTSLSELAMLFRSRHAQWSQKVQKN